MARVGVDDGSSELVARPRKHIAIARARPEDTTRAGILGDVASPGSSWKEQLTRSLTKGRDRLLTPPQQQEPSKHPVVTREMLRAMPLRPWLRFYLSRPEESTPGWVIHHCVIVVLVLNTCVLAVQTLDGPHFASAAPAYPFLPSASFFAAAERAFSALYVAEFAVRWATASSQRKYWRAKQTWVGLLALLPIFIGAGAQVVTNADTRAAVETVVYNLQLVRVLRIPVLSRVHVGSKVMFDAISKSVAPLRVTVFFLIAVVMVFATGIFYAEPCYDLEACTFTDIFNAGYFVMVTVATVGYGSQVPSLNNAGSLLLSCVVMIFGQLYISMPLAIIGMNYTLAWSKHDERMKEIEDAKLRKQFAEVAAALSLSRAKSDLKPPRRATYSEMQPMQSSTVLLQSHQVLSMYCELTQRVGETSHAILRLLHLARAVGHSPAPLTRQAPNATAAANQLSLATSVTKVLASLAAILKLHKSLAGEIRASLLAQQARELSMQKASAARDSVVASSSSVAASDNRRTRRTSSIVAMMFGRATQALRVENPTKYVKKRFYHSGPATFRSIVWNIYEHNDYSRLAVGVNRARLAIILSSLALFYLQTTPELQHTGVDSLLCRHTIEDFCSSRHAPGCYAFDANDEPTAIRLDYHCSATTPTDRSACFGEANNFGSTAFRYSCSDAFGAAGVRRVCNNRLCKSGAAAFADMESQWVYFEFAFGIVFTIEMLLRVYAHPSRQHLWKDATLLVDLLALFPFYVEVGEILCGLHPVYSVIPTEPSFFTVIRTLKAIRIVKVGTHIPGARVLMSTAQLVYQRLAIPLFFLFLGCVVSGAIFYELERGKACFVGQECRWMNKSVLTPVLAQGLPLGKRLLIQNTVPVILTDMLRSTWLALVTFTTVGYGDVTPRTSLGRLFDIVAMVFSACYTAMPLSLVGGQFYVCYEAFVADEKKRRQSWNSAMEHERRSGKSGRRVSRHAHTAVVPLTNPTAAPIVSASASSGPSTASCDRQLPSLALSTANTPPPALQVSDSPARLSVLTRALQTRPSAKVLAQFAMVDKIVTRVMADLNALNFQASPQRRGSVRWSTRSAREAPDKDDVEQKIVSNMRFVETVIMNCAPVVENIQDFSLDP